MSYAMPYNIEVEKAYNNRLTITQRNKNDILACLKDQIMCL